MAAPGFGCCCQLLNPTDKSIPTVLMNIKRLEVPGKTGDSDANTSRAPSRAPKQSSTRNAASSDQDPLQQPSFPASSKIWNCPGSAFLRIAQKTFFWTSLDTHLQRRAQETPHHQPLLPSSSKNHLPISLFPGGNHNGNLTEIMKFQVSNSLKRRDLPESRLRIWTITR